MPLSYTFSPPLLFLPSWNKSPSNTILILYVEIAPIWISYIAVEESWTVFAAVVVQKTSPDCWGQKLAPRTDSTQALLPRRVGRAEWFCMLWPCQLTGSYGLLSTWRNGYAPLCQVRKYKIRRLMLRPRCREAPGAWATLRITTILKAKS